MIMALAPSLRWLFLGRVLAGLSSSSIPTAAYISDVTTPEKRSKAFGLLGAAFGVGFVVGRQWADGSACTVHACRSGLPERPAW